MNAQVSNVLDLYVVWHPSDPAGQAVAQALLEHFRRSAFKGLLSGAIEVFFRSAPWDIAGGPPRPIDITSAQYVAVLPILGREMAAATRAGTGDWWDYLEEVANAIKAKGADALLLPIQLPDGSIGAKGPTALFGTVQPIRLGNGGVVKDTAARDLCRDVAQALTQFLSSGRITLFISHTKHETSAERNRVKGLIDQVLLYLMQTRLNLFFDAHDIQASDDWVKVLEDGAKSCALLGLRTDLYASREWCQREVMLAKQKGVPVLMVEALTKEDERGCFLLDHTPRVRVEPREGCEPAPEIGWAVARLVDLCLRRALWQKQCAPPIPPEVTYWSHAMPEPSTLLDHGDLCASPGPKVVIYPEPPLSAAELEVLDKLVEKVTRRSVAFLTARQWEAHR